MSGTEQLLDVNELRVDYRGGPAVAGVSFTIAPGEVVGLVGESGAGKSTIGRAILGLVPVRGGTIGFGGRDITRAPRTIRRRLGSQIQVVFQDPYGSLNPAVTVGASLLEALPAGTPRGAGRERLAELLADVGLPESVAREYPGRFSGGQRQRLAIARALMAKPKLVICDEPVSALDVSIQAQVLNLLRSLRDGLSLSYLFIGHDLDVVRFMSDRILVLYRGRVLEEGPADLVATAPRHPYTQALVASAPKVDAALRGHRPRPVIRPVPRFAPPGTGCPFADRCPHVTDLCRTRMPPLTDAAGGGRVACHHYPVRLSQEGGEMRSHRRWHPVGAGLALALLSAAGCSSAGTGTTSGSGGSSRSGTLTIAFSSATQTQDPSTSASPLYDFPAYDSLIYQAPDGSYEPDLATSWGYVGSGNTTFELTLRKGVRFSDGSPMTPAAVAASLNRYVSANKGSPITGPVSSVTVSGSDQVEIHYSSSVPYAFAAWSLTPAVGFGMIVGPKGLADQKGLATDTDGAGPYVFDASESVSGGNQVYVPDKYYFNQAAIRYDKVVIEPITSNSSELAAAQSGQVLVDVNLTGSQMSTARSAGMQIVTQPAGDADDLILEKTTSGPLANPKVREAIEDAMPRSQILSAVFAGAGITTSSNSQDGFAGYDASDVDLYPYDVTTAKALLSQAGYSRGFSLTVLTGLGTTPTFAEAVSVALEAIGINVSITNNTGGFPQFAAAAATKQYTALALTTPAQSIYTTLKSAMLPGQTENLWGATDSALTSDLVAAATGSTVAAQNAALREVTDRLDHLAWIVPIAVTASYAAVASGVHNVAATNNSQLIVVDPFSPETSQSWYGS